MSDPSIDPERIAAFLDGKLDAAARDALIAEIARDPELLEIYGDVIVAMREAELASPTVVPITAAPTTARSTGARAVPWRRIAIAAAVVVAVGLPIALRRGEGTAPDPSRAILALAAPDAGLAAGWDGTPWSTMRGTASATVDAARAVRLGARLADLTVSVRAHQAATADIARDASALLDGFAAAAPIAARLATVTANTPPDELAAVARDAAAVAGADAVARGALIESARIAANAGDRAFFDAPAWIAGMRTLPGDTPARAQLVATIRQTTAHGNDPMGAYLALTDLLRDLAG